MHGLFILIAIVAFWAEWQYPANPELMTRSEAVTAAETLVKKTSSLRSEYGEQFTFNETGGIRGNAPGNSFLLEVQVADASGRTRTDVVKLRRTGEKGDVRWASSLQGSTSTPYVDPYAAVGGYQGFGLRLANYSRTVGGKWVVLVGGLVIGALLSSGKD